MIIYVLLAIILASILFVTEIIDLAERRAWRGQALPPACPAWRAMISTVCFTVIAVIGVVILLARQPVDLDALDVAILSNFTFAALSVLWAQDKRQSAGSTARWLAIGCVTLGIGLTSSVDECVMLMAVGSGMVLVLGLVDEMRERPRVTGLGFRLWGVIGSNKQAINCVLFAFSAAFLYQTGHLSLGTTAALVGFSSVLLVLFRSRTALVAAVVATVAWVYTLMPAWRADLVILSVLIGASTIVISLHGTTRQFISSVVLLGRSTKWYSLGGRRLIWVDVVRAIRDHPILGHGYGSFWNQHSRADLQRKNPWHLPPIHAYSMYLEVLLNGGIGGVIFFAVALGLAWHAGLHAPVPVGPFVIALLTFTMVHGICESMLTLPLFRSLSILAVLVAL